MCTWLASSNMDRIRNFFRKKRKLESVPEVPSAQPTVVVQPPVQRRRKRPAPQPPNTPQVKAVMPASLPGYAPPTNLFAGYRYAENVLDPWQNDINSPSSHHSTSQSQQSFDDPVEESKQAWAQYDRQQWIVSIILVSPKVCSANLSPQSKSV